MAQLTGETPASATMHIMNAEERLAQLKVEFSKNLASIPHDISVPKYERWGGPGPIPMADFVIEYDADVKSILDRVLNADQTLGLLRRRLNFRLTEQSRTLTISFSPVVESSDF